MSGGIVIRTGICLVKCNAHMITWFVKVAIIEGSKFSGSSLV